MANIKQRINAVRESLDNAGDGLSPDEWKKVLEEIATDITGHMEALEEESGE